MNVPDKWSSKRCISWIVIFWASRQNMRKSLEAGNYFTPFFPTPMFSSFCDFLCYSSPTSFNSSNEPNYSMIPECNAIIYIRCLVHLISMLHIIIMQTNADTFTQLFSLRSIIRTKFSGLSFLFSISSIDRIIFSRLLFHASPSSRVCRGSSFRLRL